MKCETCDGTGQVEPAKGTHGWAMDMLKEGKEVEATWWGHGEYRDIRLDKGDDRPIWSHGMKMHIDCDEHPDGHERKYRLKPTPPEPEIVEWERCDTHASKYVTYKHHERPELYTGRELADLKEWQLVNFTILLPEQRGEIKVDADHVWWNPKSKGWRCQHETSELGSRGYTQRIDARCANMLKEVPDEQA